VRISDYTENYFCLYELMNIYRSPRSWLSSVVSWCMKIFTTRYRDRADTLFSTFFSFNWKLSLWLLNTSLPLMLELQRQLLCISRDVCTYYNIRTGYFFSVPVCMSRYVVLLQSWWVSYHFSESHAPSDYTYHGVDRGTLIRIIWNILF
jgi:hypothetical protein